MGGLIEGRKKHPNQPTEPIVMGDDEMRDMRGELN